MNFTLTFSPEAVYRVATVQLKFINIWNHSSHDTLPCTPLPPTLQRSSLHLTDLSSDCYHFISIPCLPKLSWVKCELNLFCHSNAASLGTGTILVCTSFYWCLDLLRYVGEKKEKKVSRNYCIVNTFATITAAAVSTAVVTFA